MKKLLLIVLSFWGISCSKLEDFNHDIKNPTTADAPYFFYNAEKQLASYMGSVAYQATGPGVCRMFVQHMTAVTYTEGATYFPQYDWGTMYTEVLNDLKKSEEVINETLAGTPLNPTQLQNQLQVIQILRTYAFATLVEAWGNVPYSEALIYDNPSAKYDDAKTIYEDLLVKLTSAINVLDVSDLAFGSGDLIYGNEVSTATPTGDVIAWKKFGNSLKLRMGMRIMDADPQVGAAAVQEAVASGVFTANDDNAQFAYLASSPNTNPWWTFLVQNKLKYFVATNTFMNELNGLNDPRKTIFFSPNGQGQYVGGVYGIVEPYDPFSPMGSRYTEPTIPFIFMDYSAVEFLLAEAAERGIGGVSDAAGHYKTAIQASFDFYDLEGFDDYYGQANVAYETAAGDWKEKIGRQKWIALFDQGFEAWTEYRRLDYPVLSVPPGASSDVVPRRFNYPIGEQTLNGQSYQEASSAIGGDMMSTKLFWDVY